MLASYYVLLRLHRCGEYCYFIGLMLKMCLLLAGVTVDMAIFGITV